MSVFIGFSKIFPKFSRKNAIYRYEIDTFRWLKYVVFSLFELFVYNNGRSVWFYFCPIVDFDLTLELFLFSCFFFLFLFVWIFSMFHISMCFILLNEMARLFVPKNMNLCHKTAIGIANDIIITHCVNSITISVRKRWLFILALKTNWKHGQNGTSENKALRFLSRSFFQSFSSSLFILDMQYFVEHLPNKDRSRKSGYKFIFRLSCCFCRNNLGHNFRLFVHSKERFIVLRVFIWIFVARRLHRMTPNTRKISRFQAESVEKSQKAWINPILEWFFGRTFPQSFYLYW